MANKTKGKNKSRSERESGKIYLVGAGPGDLGLVTLRAKECIEQADVIVYDHLANPEMLSWARDSAEIVYVGKRAGAHSLSQQEINALLIEKAGCPIEGWRSVCFWTGRGRGKGNCRCGNWI